MDRRLYLVFTSLLLVFSLIVVKLFYWQVIASERLKGVSEDQRNRAQTVKAKRGEIFDANLSPLVINQPAYLLFAEPEKIKDRHKTASELAPNLAVEEASLSAKMDTENLKWVSLGEKIEA